ncbi:MAG: AAA family ATPase [Prevotella sp.]|nr:AAA family ATPase [Prevotella sp.]
MFNELIKKLQHVLTLLGLCKESSFQNSIKYYLKVLNFNEYKELESDYRQPTIIKDIYDSSVKNGKIFNAYNKLSDKKSKKKNPISVVIMPRVIKDIDYGADSESYHRRYPLSLLYIKVKLNSNNEFKWKDSQVYWNLGLDKDLDDLTPSEEDSGMPWEDIKKKLLKSFNLNKDSEYVTDKTGDHDFLNGKDSYNHYMHWVMRYEEPFDITIVKEADIINGELDPIYYKKLYRNVESGEDEVDKEDEERDIDIAIVPKLFEGILRDRNDGNENSKPISPFYIKTKLQADNRLALDKTEVIWANCIESPSEVDGISFKISENKNKENKTSWKAYIDSVKKIYEERYRMNEGWNSSSIRDTKGGEHGIVSPKSVNGARYWIMRDDTVTHVADGIIELLTYLYNHPKTDVPLLRTLIEHEVTPIHSERKPGANFSEHHGQMKNDFPLADAQREVLHSFTKLEDGDVLAVSGPPGTGKTTLLQSVVAEMIVQRAIEKKDAPIILATSSNNKAITNIIDAFKIEDKEKVANPLFTRWITYNNKPLPLAVYWPSQIIRKDYCAKQQNPSINKDDKIPFFSDNNGSDNYESLKGGEKIESNFIALARGCGKEDLSGITISELKVQLHELLLKKSTELGVYDNLSNPEEKIKHLKGMAKAFTKIPAEKPNAFDEKMESVNQKPGKEVGKEVDVPTNEKIDRLLDMSLRFECFWLAVHYYEACWIEKIMKEDEEYDDTHSSSKLQELLKEMTMVCPCIVATFFKAPVYFKNGKEKDGYLFNSIDLLIVDEAGQACLENGLATFALAKKAIVVGDVQQIPPVYSIAPIVSEGYWKATTHKTKDDELFKLLTCARLPKPNKKYRESSVMVLASKKSKFIGKDKKDKDIKGGGLFLDEHRRCYNEIIDYSNRLLYNNELTPCKGFGAEKDVDLPIMAYRYVKSDNSIQGKDAKPIYEEWMREHNIQGNINVKGSRMNLDEINEIVKWIKNNKNFLEYKYNKKLIEKLKQKDGKEFLGEKELKQNKDYKHIHDIVYIITPFKLQAELLKSALGEDFKNSIGTVHAFQGAESPIVIYSTVYGSKEEFSFINEESGPNLMNVAVSRAKEHFFLFCSKKPPKANSIDITKTSTKKAFSLLLEMASEELKPNYTLNSKE